MQQQKFLYIQHTGEYRDGKKLNRWDIKLPIGITIGGGNYNECGLKQGRWVEVEIAVIGYGILLYIQHVGDYNDGQRINHWVINDPGGRKIGGGNYNNLGIKVGQWTDIDYGKFRYGSKFCYSEQIGEYKDGLRINHWNIKCPLNNIIGGGSYDEQGRKHGQWIDCEVIELPSKDCQIVQHKGEYKDGQKVNQWNSTTLISVI